MRVVLAANSVRFAARYGSDRRAGVELCAVVPVRAASDADTADSGAGKADHGIRIRDDDTKSREELRDSRVAGLLNASAALDFSSAAGFRARASAGCRGGNSKDYEGGDGEELGEHSVQ